MTTEMTLPTTEALHQDTYRGIPYAVLMGPYTINGYMQMEEDHPWTEIKADWDIPTTVHGGITYREGLTIGFGTNHYGDGWHPHSLMHRKVAAADDTYIQMGRVWSAADVIAETHHLIDEYLAAKDTHK